MMYALASGGRFETIDVVIYTSLTLFLYLLVGRIFDGNISILLIQKATKRGITLRCVFLHL